ncbi:penicillin-binding protein 2 [Aliivibrio sifiae]|uniref:Peptidoglycan D,D-transpeptidase MrdA n=1 Tax=Aliivibrio sifiae TaxID=566293 RepID=A0A2S7XDQ1_9GAMM|nr:penicillin-binding protein 2 [Aliivibrio sifiae]PQJ89377.1 penicillin-binding protein 2 [Aliivibrio sifiae]
MFKQKIPFRNHEFEVSLFNQRVIIAFLFMLIAIGGLIFNLYYLQVKDHDKYQVRSNHNRIKIIPIAPNRGLIYDHNGVLLAQNIPISTLELIPAKIANINETLTSLKKLLSLSDKDISEFKKVMHQNRSTHPITLIEQMSEVQIAKFSVNQFHYDGTHINAYLERHYPYGASLTHVLGYVGKINDRDIRNLKKDHKYINYKGTKAIGKLGIELYYEDMLHGKSGYEKVEIDSRGRIVRTLDYVAPTSGKDIKLNIDLGLQLYAYNQLKMKKENPITHKMEDYQRRGSIVVLDPRDNSILAMVSSPSYDPNLFVHGISSKRYNALLNNPDLPLLNRTTLGIYPPGSTVKPQIAVAALSEKVITPNTTSNFPGWWQIPHSNSRKFRDDIRWGHGEVNVVKAIEKSVDTFFYQVAYDMGIDRLSVWMNKFGYGKPSGIDIREESSANMPTRDWKYTNYHQAWYKGDTIPVGIGQGYWTATPIQIAKATAVIADEGIVHRPHLLKSVMEHGKFKDVTFKDFPQVSHTKKLYWDLAKEGMHRVLVSGTARKLFQNLAYDAGGKTGTSQVFGLDKGEKYNSKELAEHLRDHALFTSFAPLDTPKVLVTTILENAGWGKYAAPIGRNIMDYVLVNPKINLDHT